MVNPMPKSSVMKFLALGGLFAVVAIIGLSVTMSFFPGAEAQVKPLPAQTEPMKVAPISAAQLQLSYAPVVKRVAPAVVNVFSKRTVKSQVPPFMNEPLFRKFFGDQLKGLQRERVQQSLGSGVIVDPSGLIVTNNHVIAGGEQFTVALADRREFEAKLVLADERTDLAVLRIVPKGGAVPYLAFKDSDAVEVGDLVLAIGNPFGVGQTVTSGIVSALARTHVGVSDYQFFIQTDAAINPGNSGGALVTMDGRVIGINSAIFSQTGGSIGIGFAIPSNMVRLVVESAKAGGTVKRPWTGAQLQAVDNDLAASLNLDRPGGSLIRDIYPKGPLASAGLQVGDVIRSVDGQSTDDPQAVRYRFATKPLGGKVSVQYVRDGKLINTEAALEAAPETPAAEKQEVKGRNPFTGATIANLSPAIAEQLGIDAMGGKGVVIVSIRPNTPAAQLRFQPGDIVVELNELKITNVKMLLVHAEATARPQWDFKIKRGDQVLSASIAR
jgi:Do/DeqQ family serine protease